MCAHACMRVRCVCLTACATISSYACVCMSGMHESMRVCLCTCVYNCVCVRVGWLPAPAGIHVMELFFSSRKCNCESRNKVENCSKNLKVTHFKFNEKPHSKILLRKSEPNISQWFQSLWSACNIEKEKLNPHAEPQCSIHKGSAQKWEHWM